MATSIGFAKALTRLGNFALDDSSVFTSVVSLNNYLSSGTCYTGQIVALVDTTTGNAKIYKIEGKIIPFTITQIDSASISLDNVSLDNNTSSKLELKGFESANNDTVVIKNGTGIVGYLGIEKNSSNAYTTVASKEYVDMLVQGGVVLQGVDYDASTNTPNINTIVVGIQAYAWHINVSGTQILDGKSFEFKVNDWVVKTVSGGYLHIDNNTSTISWGVLSGNISDQLDLKTALDKKTDKVPTAITNNISIFDATGNLLDGGKKISDLVLNTTTVNGHPLNANITLDKTDIGLTNVKDIDTTDASKITTGTLPSAQLPIADSTNIGGVKAGTNITIDADGTINSTGGSGTYTNANPVPTTIGGISSGTTFNSTSISSVLDKLLYPYQLPIFSSFTITGLTNPLEVGTSLSANPTFTWGVTNPTNISANTVKITDVTGGNAVLVTGSANDGIEIVTLSAITKSTATSHQFKIEATDTKSTVFNKTLTVNWQWKRYYGESTNTPLVEADIKGLRVNGLSSGFAGTYSFNTGGYKYICYPSVLGTATSFKDASTNLTVPFQTVYTVSVTNGSGIATNYNVHRTTNIIGGAINIIVA